MNPFRWYGDANDLALVLTVGLRTIVGAALVAERGHRRSIAYCRDVDQAIESIAENHRIYLVGPFTKHLPRRFPSGGFDYELPSLMIEGPFVVDSRERLSWARGLPPRGSTFREGMVATSRMINPGLDNARRAMAKFISATKRVLVPVGPVWLGPFAYHAVKSERATVESVRVRSGTRSGFCAVRERPAWVRLKRKQAGC